MRTILIPILLLFIFFVPQGTWAQDEINTPYIYSLGDQVLSIGLGPFIPIFFLSFDGLVAATNLTVGGYGSLQWNTYLSNSARIGVEVGGCISFGPNRESLLMLPIMFKGSYVLYSNPFEFPISLSIGMNVLKYQSFSSLDLLIKPSISGYWAYNKEWSFGLNISYWWDLQISRSEPEQSRMGNFIDISLSALYHF